MGISGPGLQSIKKLYILNGQFNILINQKLLC